MAVYSDFSNFSEYVEAFNHELQHAEFPANQINDKVSACAFLALSNRGDFYARTHPDMKRKAITLLQEKKEAPIIINGVDLAPVDTRCIVRLWRDEKTRKLVMVLERIYPQIAPVEYKEELKIFAKEEAARIGVPLVSVEEGDPNRPYKGTLVRLRGRMPEYIDSAGGMQEGACSIEQAYYV